MRGLRGSRGLNQSAYRLHARLFKIKTAVCELLSPTHFYFCSNAGFFFASRPFFPPLRDSLARAGRPRDGRPATGPCEEAEQSHQDVLDQGPEEI